jgi:hypothetical protein
VNAEDLQSVALAALGSPTSGHRMMSGLWKDGAVLQVVRREPHATKAGKILPLHVEPFGAASR